MKNLLLAAAFATLIAAPAFAQVSPSMPMPRGPGMGGRPPMMRERMEQRMEQLTPAQREEMQKRMEARKAKWNAMTPEQQQQIKDNFEKRMQERKAQWDAMPQAEREAKMAQMKERMEKLKAMSPAERDAAIAKMSREGNGDMMPVPPAPAN